MAEGSRGSPATINGRLGSDPTSEDITCTYLEGPNSSLTWTTGNQSGSQGEENSHEIMDDQIICLQLSSQENKEYQLYYADILPSQHAEDSEDSKPQRNTHLRILTLASPPQSLIEKYNIVPTSPLLSISLIRPIISTHSGGHHAEAIYTNLVAPFLAHILNGNTHTIEAPFYTTSSTSITALTAGPILTTATAGTPQLLLLLSGDGGIVDIINTFPPSPPLTRPTIALLPCGTGNALANSTSINPLAPRTLGLRTLALGTPHPLPLLTASFSPPAAPYAPAPPSPPTTTTTTTTPAPQHPDPTPAARAAVVVSWGLHAALVADSDTPAARALGAARFQRAAQDNLFPADGGPPHAYRGALALRHAPGAPWADVARETHAYVLATQVAQLERGFTVSPAARALDGVLRVVHFGPREGGGEGVMRLMMAAYRGGGHVEGEGVGYAAVAGMRVVFGEEEERWRRVCVDGKIFVVARGGEMVVESGAERVVELLHVDGA